MVYSLFARIFNAPTLAPPERGGEFPMFIRPYLLKFSPHELEQCMIETGSSIFNSIFYHILILFTKQHM